MSSSFGSNEGGGTGRGRGAKRKLGDRDAAGGGGMGGGGERDRDRGGERGGDRGVIRKTKGELATPSLGPNSFPKDHPFNRDGYRYILAEADPHSPFRQEFDESTDMAGKPIPGFLCRVLTPETVLLALHDRASQVTVSDDRCTVTGYKFYCTIRANHSVSRGSWYFETKLVDVPDGAATRIGWAQKYANLQAPLGFDKFGYSVRSRKGTKFHESIGKSYSDGYGQGDYLGCLITLPELTEMDYLPDSYKDKPLVKVKSHFYFEEKDREKEASKTLKKLPGSKIYFFKNGECLGEAFQDIYAGDYFPALATYKGAKVKVNFGPKFRYPPKGGFKQKPMSARADQVAVEQSMADMRFFTEKEGTLSLDNYFMSS